MSTETPDPTQSPVDPPDLEARAYAVVSSYLGVGMAVDIRPRPEDYALAFVPEVVDRARQGYESLFARHAARPVSKPGQTRVELHLALASELATSEVFPGGYRRVAHLLVPHRTWVVWRYLAPGATAGMAHNGLVWLDDHWAWFPKPWRVLG